MSTEVERGRGLEREGIQHRPRPLESGSRRPVRRGRPAAGRTDLPPKGRCRAARASTPAARRTTNSSSASRRVSSDIAWGKVNRPMDRSAVRHASPGHAGLARRQGTVRPGSATPGADPTYRLPVRIINEFAWHNLFCRNMFIDDPQAAEARVARVHDHRLAELQGRSAAARHATPTSSSRQLREEARAHRRHELRRRDEEIDLHDAQLHPAAAGRAVDALLGQHRHGRRRRALLRPVGHRQDDAVERSRSAC